jgi:hypothetical protein
MLTKLKSVLFVQSIAALATLSLSDPASAQPPEPKMVVGTSACPKLNKHDRKACVFKRAGHEFQVWPDRIAVEATNDPVVWLVTSAHHPDGMFDHVLALRRDDHITYQCLVRNDGIYYGPTGFQIKRGGVRATYGRRYRHHCVAHCRVPVYDGWHDYEEVLKYKPHLRRCPGFS